MRKAYFAGGCFWCITPPLRNLPGVSRVTSGYCGGCEEAPSYQAVKSQQTGHRETVCVEYDPAVLPYENLVKTFLDNVDPFDGGGQFIDRGHSYTLAIYWETPEEEETANRCILQLEEEACRKTAVAVEKAGTFWRAEEYHQNYDLKNPEAFEKELRESGRKDETHA